MNIQQILLGVIVGDFLLFFFSIMLWLFYFLTEWKVVKFNAWIITIIFVVFLFVTRDFIPMIIDLIKLLV